MKKMIALFLVAAIATTSCKKDKGVDCMGAVNKMRKLQKLIWAATLKKIAKLTKQLCKSISTVPAFQACLKIRKMITPRLLTVLIAPININSF